MIENQQVSTTLLHLSTPATLGMTRPLPLTADAVVSAFPGPAAASRWRPPP
jgi:hypothetical protein